MSSQPNLSESSSSPTPDDFHLDDHQIRRLTLFLPFIVRLAVRHHNPHDSILDLPLRIILFNPATRTTLMIDPSVDFEGVSTKPGLLPASKDSMAALPMVIVTEQDTDCAICLEDYEVGAEAKEMPCKHRFHSHCIERWLGIHGLCPICRFPMPGDDRDGELDGGQTTQRSDFSRDSQHDRSPTMDESSTSRESLNVEP